jgi:hypothetical protein
MSLARYLANLLNSSGQVEAAKLAASLDLSSKTLTYPDNSVQSADIASLAASKLSGQVPGANAPSGSVIQVVVQANPTSVTASSGVAGWYTIQTATITPKFSTSNILIICREHASADIDNDGQGISYLQTRILRNGNQIKISASNLDVRGGNQRVNDAGWKTIDSPATTSAITYTTQWQNTIANSSGRNSYFNIDQMGHIILMEIAA